MLFGWWHINFQNIGRLGSVRTFSLLGWWLYSQLQHQSPPLRLACLAARLQKLPGLQAAILRRIHGQPPLPNPLTRMETVAQTTLWLWVPCHIVQMI